MRYRVSDLPTRGTGAFTPIPKRTPMASSYGLVKITAALGLEPVPVTPVPFDGLGADSKTQPSNVSPNLILRDTYVAHADNMGPSADAGIGMSMRRHNPLPVPAASWIPVAPDTFRAARFGGRRAMSWPRAFQRWGTQS